MKKMKSPLTTKQRHEAYEYVLYKMRLGSTYAGCMLLDEWLLHNLTGYAPACAFPGMCKKYFPEFYQYYRPGKILWFDSRQERVAAITKCIKLTKPIQDGIQQTGGNNRPGGIPGTHP